LCNWAVYLRSTQLSPSLKSLSPRFSFPDPPFFEFSLGCYFSPGCRLRLRRPGTQDVTLSSCPCSPAISAHPSFRRFDCRFSCSRPSWQRALYNPECKLFNGRPSPSRNRRAFSPYLFLPAHEVASLFSGVFSENFSMFFSV